MTSPTIVRKSTSTGVPPLRPYLSEVWRYRAFIIRWSQADVKARNLETMLGRLWHVLNPLLFGAIYFVFTGIIAGSFGGLEKLAFIVGNLYVWLFFAGIISTGVGSITSGAGGLLAQTAVPRLVMPLSVTLTSMNLFLRSLIAYVPIHFIGSRSFHAELLILPVLTFLTAVIALGISLLFAVLNVYLKDTSRLLPHFLRLWLYLSPVIWLYEKADGDGVESLARLNPMYSGMKLWTICLGGKDGRSDASFIQELLSFSLWSVVLFVLGVLFFTAKEDNFAIRS